MKSTLLNVSLSFILLTTVAFAATSTRTENFNTGLGHFSTEVRNQENGNNFGYSTSNNAGGTSGEVGGTFRRVSSPAYVADADLNGGLDPAVDDLLLRGKIYVHNINANHSMFVGYRTETLSQGFDLLIAEPGGGASDPLRCWVQMGGTQSSMIPLPQDTALEFDLTWTAASGMVSGIVAGVTVEFSASPGSLAFDRVLVGTWNGSSEPWSAQLYVDDLSYTVLPPPVADPPTVSLTSPSATTWISAGDNLVITAAPAFYAPATAITNVSFYASVNGAEPTKLGDATASPFTITWSGVPSGRHVLTAKAYDNLGGVGTSGSVQVNARQVLAPRTEIFYNGLGHFSTEVRNHENGNNFGWTNSNNTQSYTGGELGGVLTRVIKSSAAYMADTALNGVLIPAVDDLVLKGKIYARNINANQSMYVGYFSSTLDGGFNLLIGEPGGAASEPLRCWVQMGGTWGPMVPIPQSAPLEFDLKWTATNGNIAGTVAGVSVNFSAPAGSLVFDRMLFGTWDGSSGPFSAEIFVDNLQYNIVQTGAPVFNSDPVYKPAAIPGQPYSGTLADSASDPNGDSITFSKLSGPAWLNVAPNGTLSGTPTIADGFTNAWTVSVSDGTLSNTATLIIYMEGNPTFLTDPVLKPNGKVGVDYAATAATLSGDAFDPTGDPLQFTKGSGPAWLQITPGGLLSGIPTPADVGTNKWTITASDGTHSSQAALEILVLPAASPVLVTGAENWDGVQNPHAGEGVTLSGSGSQVDPALYTIPVGLTITGTGIIRMPPTATGDRSIKFQFVSGDLQMEQGAIINLGRQNREGTQLCLMDMGGGSITGAGVVTGMLAWADSPRVLTILNVSNVYLSALDLHIENANNSGRHLTIEAVGAVNIGRIDNSDHDTGGSSAGNIQIQAPVITVGSIDTRAMRSDGTASNGDILLNALGAPGYDPNLDLANTFNNKLTINGPVTAAGAGLDGGNITLRGVRLQFGAGFSLNKPANATQILENGVIRAGVSASNLFYDASGSGLNPVNTVQWSGDAVILPEEPTTLAYVRSNNQLQLSWPPDYKGWLLESNALSVSQGNAWFTIPGSADTNRMFIGIESTKPKVFFRLRYPTP